MTVINSNMELDMDEKLQWLETRIKSSLQPRNDDLKNFFINEQNRQVVRMQVKHLRHMMRIYMKKLYYG